MKGGVGHRRNPSVRAKLNADNDQSRRWRWRCLPQIDWEIDRPLNKQTAAGEGGGGATVRTACHKTCEVSIIQIVTVLPNA